MNENSNWNLQRSNLTIVQIAAAIGVIFSHSYRIGVGGKEPLSAFAYGKCTCGTVAVAIFLLISGFTVSQSYSSARGSIKTVAAGLYNFVIRRFLRIFPVVAFAIVVCTFCLGPFVSSLSHADYFSHPLTWRYMRGIWLHSFHAALPGVFVHNELKTSVNGSLWVIPWQMWCYWLVALFGVLGLHKNRRLVLVCCSLAWALFYGRFVLLKGMSWPGGISVMQGSRLLAFFLTGWVAALYKDKIVLDGKLAAGLALSMPIWIWTSASDLALAFAGFYILLYLIFRHPVGWLQKLPPISFGIFVFGFPAQQTFAHFWGGKMPHWSNFLLSVAVVIPIALLEYWTIERPMKWLSKKLSIKMKSHEQN